MMLLSTLSWGSADTWKTLDIDFVRRASLWFEIYSKVVDYFWTLLGRRSWEKWLYMIEIGILTVQIDVLKSVEV